VSHLKNKGIDSLVFDMNAAYLSRHRFFWFLFMFRRRSRDLALAIVNSCVKGSRDRKIRKRFFLKKIFYNPMTAAIDNLTRYLEDREKGRIPWSLESIIDSALEGGSASTRRKISDILRPVIEKEDLSLIGISVVYPEQLFFALMIARVIKEDFGKDMPVVLGGSQITKHIAHIVNNKKVYDFVNFLVVGDGEKALSDLLDRPDEKSFSNIPNLYFKSRKIGRKYERSGCDFYLDAGDIPAPDFTGFDLDIYEKALPILISKGCTWSKCNFCTYASLQEHRYSINNVARTIEIIKEMNARYKASEFRFIDDELPSNFLERLAAELFKSGLDIKWSCSVTLNEDFADRAFCETLKIGGLNGLTIGLESASPRILGLMNKRHQYMAKEAIEGILSTLKEAGIDVGLHIIFGFPTETLDEVRQTVDFLVDNRDMYADCWAQPFCLEEDTPVFKNPERFGITKIYRENKVSGERLGYRYEVTGGMSQEAARSFTYGEAKRALKR
jgi:radical SAM superfamily enzyme YgiQ (UPF0313 family)